MVRHNDGSRTVTAKSNIDPNSPLKVGKSQTISTYDPEGVLRLKRVYQINQYNKPETFVIYDGNSRPLIEGRFEYDFQHRLVKEELYELPSRKLVRRQTHNYTVGDQRTVNTVNYGPLPPALLRWMDPDGYVAGVKTPEASKNASRGIWHRGGDDNKPANNNASEKEEKRGGLFGRFRRKSK